VLHRVHSNLSGKLQLVGSVGDDSDNLVWFKATVVQLSTEASGGYVFRVKSYQILDLERRGGGSASVRVFLMSGLSASYFSSKIIVNFLKTLSHSSSVNFLALSDVLKL
jgi:hypothetical protein